MPDPTVDDRTVAAYLGVSVRDVQRAREAQGLIVRVERVTRVLEAQRRAAEGLPRLAAWLLSEECEDPCLPLTVAVELGLARESDSREAALDALRALSLADDLPAQRGPEVARAERKAKPPSAKGERPLSEASEALLEAVREQPGTQRELAQRLGRDPRGVGVALANLHRHGHVACEGKVWSVPELEPSPLVAVGGGA